MKLLRIAGLSLLLCLLATCALAAELPPLEVYLVDPCGGCKNPQDPCGPCRLEIAQENRLVAFLEEIGQAERAVKIRNLRRELDAYDELLERLALLGMEDFVLPLLFVGDAVFPAYAEMDAFLAEYLQGGAYPGYDALAEELARIQANKPLRSILFFTEEGDADCEDVEAWLARSLPKDIEIRHYDMESGEGPDVARAVFAMFSLGERERKAPLIVYGDYTFSGKHSIYLSLLSRIEEYPEAVTMDTTSLLLNYSNESGGC